MNQQAKEKAPQTAATAQGATKENNVQNQSTADQVLCQARLLDKLDEAARDVRGIAELLDAVSIAMESDLGYDKGLWLLAQVAYRRADELSKEEEDASNA